jgi:hypothetical protein
LSELYHLTVAPTGGWKALQTAVGWAIAT